MKLWRKDDGTSLVEFALVAPVLIFLLIGMIEIGRFGYYAILAANAARAGAQYGSQDLSKAQDTDGIKNAVAQDGQNLSNWNANGAITATPLCSVNGGALQTCGAGSSPAAGNVYYVRVQVTGTFTSLLHYPGLPAQLPVSGSATMRVVYQ
jgi:Flp pilus assembly protein TadG